MSDQSGTAPQPISLDQLTEAITSGVMRALSSQAFADKDGPVNVARLATERGIFGQVVVTCGQWPTGKEPPVIAGGLPGAVVAGGGAGGGDQGTPP